MTLGPKVTAFVLGFEEAVKSMQVGGRRVAIVPPHLGYGRGANDFGIPPYATLLYYIEVTGVTRQPVDSAEKGDDASGTQPGERSAAAGSSEL